MATYSTEGPGLVGRERARVDHARVLLAEDDEEVRWALQRVLEDQGWEVSIVANGTALLDAISSSFLEGKTRPPDIIVTDIRMPGLNGLNVIKGLREMGWQTPVIIMSAYGDPETRALVRCWGSAAFFDKPLVTSKLEQTMRELLGLPSFL